MTQSNLQDHLSWLLRNFSLTVPAGSVAFDPPPPQNTSNRETAGEESGELATVTAGASMDRSTIVPQISKRPGLLIQQNSLLTPASTSGVSTLRRAKAESLADGIRSLSPSTRRTRPLPQVKSTPLFLKSASCEDDGEFPAMVDLTSSDSIEEFGDSIQLWREDFASRPEPGTTARKKRKSDEMSSIKLDTVPSFKKPKTPGSSSKKEPRKALKMPASEPGSSARSRKTKQEPNSSADDARATPDPAIKTDRDTPAKPAISTRRHVKRQVVEESDDELMSPPKGSKSSAGPPSYPFGEPTSVPARTLEDHQFSRQNASPAARPVSGQQDAIQVEQKPIVDLFLACPLVLDEKTKTVDDLIKANSRDFERACREHWSKEQRDQVRAARQPLLDQQKLLNGLKSEHQTFETLTKERESLLAQIAVAYDADVDTEEDLQQLDELSKQIDNSKTALSQKVTEAGISIDDLERACDDAAARSMKPPATALPPGAHVVHRRSETTQVAESISMFVPDTQLSNGPTSAYGLGAPAVRRQEPQFHSEQAFGGYSSSTSRFFSGKPNTFKHQLPEHPFTPAFKDSRENQHSSGARTRRSPAKHTPQPFGDDFSDFSDDGEMIAAAENVELSFSESYGTRPSPRRLALVETSGNTSSLPKANVSAKLQTKGQLSQGIPQNLMNYPWSSDVRQVLKNRFGMSGFRHNQLEAINATLGGQDAFVLMPTGGGKSLCYQLPAVVSSGKTRGITIVVSPLLSLMQDQVDHLRDLQISAVSYNGEVTKEYRDKVLTVLKEPRPEEFVQLLYVTPEMINNSGAFISALKAAYRNKRVARLVIDEAHCVSQWGHDFRPDYKALGEVRKQFSGVPLIALTATATQNVIMDIKLNLKMEGCQVFSQSFNRPNLNYEVLNGKKQSIETVANLIKTKYANQTGIVYTLARKTAEKVAKELREKHGISAAHYHASIEPTEKTQVQRRWQKGHVKVVVATIAFGMGIDKPDVRFVIHHSMPKSLEGYYQETGRAGRDGKSSDCILLFSYADVRTLRSFIRECDATAEQKERQYAMLARVVAFVENRRDCRRAEVLRYFGENFNKDDCNKTCDNCRTTLTFVRHDFTALAIAALKLVEIFEGRVTMNQCVELLMGRQTNKLRSEAASESFGAGKDMKRKGDVERVVDSLIREQAIKEVNVVNKKSGFPIQYLKIGPTANAFKYSGRKLLLEMASDEESAAFSGGQTKLRTKTANTSMAPPSTNVSSPARARSRKRAAIVVDDSIEDLGLHSNGYAKDNFVVSDNDALESSDEDGFEPQPKRTPATRVSRQRKVVPDIGPPISNDARLNGARLSGVHLDVVQAFVQEAKQLEESIRNKKGLRRAQFTERDLREMAIRWTTTLPEMRLIPAINVDAVEASGELFLPLIKRFADRYREIMDETGGAVVETPPRSGQSNVVEISSDDGGDEVEDFEDEFGDLDAEAAFAEAYEVDEEYDHEYFDPAASYFFDTEGAGPSASTKRGGATSKSASAASGMPSHVQSWHDELDRLSQNKGKAKGASGSDATAGRGRGGGRGGGRSRFGGGRRGSSTYSRRGGGVAKKSGATGSRRSSGGASGTASRGGGSMARGRGGGAKSAARGGGAGAGIALMPF